MGIEAVVFAAVVGVWSPAVAPPPLEEGGRLKARLRAIVAQGFAVPPDTDPFPLALEMARFIGVTDSELRDDLIWRTFKAWVIEKNVFSPAQLRTLLGVVTDERHLFLGLGESGSDSVFTRAFSVLVVEQILVVHRRAPFLSREEVEAVRTELARYLAGEKDRRGYVEGKGWAHAVAHAADALAVLAECPEIGREHLPGLLGLIRSQASAFEVPYLHEEDERLVTAVVSVVRRRLLSQGEVEEWIRSFPGFEAREWSPREYQRLNKKAFLRSLYFQAGKHDQTRFMRPVLEEAQARLEAS